MSEISNDAPSVHFYCMQSSDSVILGIKDFYFTNLMVEDVLFKDISLRKKSQKIFCLVLG
jgi:hypothetical protein